MVLALHSDPAPDVAGLSPPAAGYRPTAGADRLSAPLARLRPLAWPLLGLAALLLVATLIPALAPAVRLAAAAAGTALAVLALVALAGGLLLRRAALRDRAVLARLIARDPDALVLTDAGGRVIQGPDAAPAGSDIARLLADCCADPAEVAATLATQALQTGHARADFTGGPGAVAISVFVADGAGPADAGDLATSGPGPEGAGATTLLWRMSRISRTRGRDVATLALPILTLGGPGQPARANPALVQLLSVPGPGPVPSLVPPAAGGQGAEGVPPAPDSAGPGAGWIAGLAARLADGATRTEVSLPDGRPALALVAPGADGQRDALILLPGQIGQTAPGEVTWDAGQAFDDIPVGILRLDAEGRIAEANRAARGLMALAADDSRFLWEVVEGLGRPVADWLQDARSGRSLNRPEVVRAIRPGAEVFVQIILRRPPGLDDPEGLLAIVSDATELKSLEARFVQSQKMQAIGQLAGGIAHDFNNLLTAISGHCDLLLIGRDPFDPDYNDLMQIHQNANRAAALVRQLLAFSRKQTLQPESLRLEDLLEDVVHLLTRLVGERIVLNLRHDPALPGIRADRRQLEQVIVNLVVNARDAMPMGGEIRIETRMQQLDQDRIIGRARVPAGDYAMIRVIDSGIGIAADQIDKIFEPFYTTKRPGEGTGLGLSTAYGIVKQMGGYIFVDSVEGSGTTFSLYFGAEAPRPALADPAAGTDEGTLRTPGAPRPRRVDPAPGLADPADGAASAPAPAPACACAPDPAGAEPVPAGPSSVPVPAAPAPAAGAAATAAPAALRRAPAITDTRAGAAPRRPSSILRAVPAPAPRASGETGGIVLLVEDEAPVRAFAARALRMQGYQVLEAQDGEQALEVLADRDLAVDIFVTDVIMPGLDGPAWVETALRDRPGTPVVFVSGYIEDSLTEALGRTPHSVFVEKPFSLDGLCKAIARQLDARGA